VADLIVSFAGSCKIARQQQILFDGSVFELPRNRQRSSFYVPLGKVRHRLCIVSIYYIGDDNV